jgi:hypothetical protein
VNHRHWKSVGALVAAATFTTLLAAWSAPRSPSQRLSESTVAFLKTLTGEQREKGMFAMDSRERQDWHFVPRDRAGLEFKTLTDSQRAAVHQVLRDALSSRGYLKVTGVIALESILRDLEMSRGSDGRMRDPGRYTVSVYGDPAASAPWSWRIEGHHLSLTLTVSPGKPISTTPTFIGANPATVPQGPQAGWRLLAAEEDLGRTLLGSLGTEQRATAVISDDAPGDIILSPGRKLDLGTPRGVRYADLAEDQRQILMHLLAEYVENFHHDIAKEQMDRIRERGLDEIRFAWAGSDVRGQAHYYRIHGPTFIIEYDNTQNDANHVHTIWHDLERNLGEDLLREHYLHDHGGGAHSHPHPHP